MYNTVTYLEKVGMAHLGFGFWDNHIIMPGAPRTIISQLNFLCDEYPTTKVKVKSFMKLMNDYFREEVTKDQETQTVSQVADATTQTDDDIRDNVEKVFELSKHLSSDALIIILETM